MRSTILCLALLLVYTPLVSVARQGLTETLGLLLLLLGMLLLVRESQGTVVRKSIALAAGFVFGLADLLFGELDLPVGEIRDVVDEPPNQLEERGLREWARVGRIASDASVGRGCARGRRGSRRPSNASGPVGSC